MEEKTYEQVLELFLDGLPIPANEETIKTFNASQLLAYHRLAATEAARENGVEQFLLVNNEIQRRLEILEMIVKAQNLQGLASLYVEKEVRDEERI